MFIGKGVLKICNKFTEEHPCQSAISIKFQSTFIEIAPRHRCSPVNLLHIRTPFLRKTLGVTASGNNNKLIATFCFPLLQSVKLTVYTEKKTRFKSKHGITSSSSVRAIYNSLVIYKKIFVFLKRFFQLLDLSCRISKFDLL